MGGCVGYEKERGLRAMIIVVEAAEKHGSVRERGFENSG